MDELSFASVDFLSKKKRTKRDVFLAEMTAVVPWSMLEALIEPHYPKAGAKGWAAAISARHDAAHIGALLIPGPRERFTTCSRCVRLWAWNSAATTFRRGQRLWLSARS